MNDFKEFFPTTFLLILLPHFATKLLEA